MKCSLCPRECELSANKKCYCGKDNKYIRIAKVMRHMWEEPIISGKNGSGAIFFSYCSLKCCYCQNYQISHLGCGKDCTEIELAEYIKKLENSKVENINFVTPTHYSDKIISALKMYKPNVPIVWNTSGYESEENIEKLKDIVDIFLFDFKYCSEDISLKYSKVKNYFDVCLNAIKKAREIVPKDIIENNIMKKGIVIRHLLLPGCYEDSIKIFKSIKDEIGTDVYISIMSQYLPFYKAKEMPELNKKIKPIEYKKVLHEIGKMGFNKGFVQDYSSSSCEYTPNFSLEKFFEI